MKGLLFTLVDNENQHEFDKWLKQIVLIDYPIEVHVYCTSNNYYSVKRKVRGFKNIFVNKSKKKEEAILNAFNKACSEAYLFLGFAAIGVRFDKTNMIDLLLSANTNGAVVPVQYKEWNLICYKAEVIRMKMIPVETCVDFSITHEDACVPGDYYAINSNVLRKCNIVLQEDDVWTELPYYFLQRSGFKFMLDQRIIF